MIVRFSTRVGAFTMHGDAAVALLRAMGHSGTVPGAILAADLPAALAQLRAALAAQVDEPPPARAGRLGRRGSGRGEARAADFAAHARRAALEMIETAIARDSDLMWERG